MPTHSTRGRSVRREAAGPGHRQVKRRVLAGNLRGGFDGSRHLGVRQVPQELQREVHLLASRPADPVNPRPELLLQQRQPLVDRLGQLDRDEASHAGIVSASRGHEKAGDPCAPAASGGMGQARYAGADPWRWRGGYRLTKSEVGQVVLAEAEVHLPQPFATMVQAVNLRERESLVRWIENPLPAGARIPSRSQSIGFSLALHPRSPPQVSGTRGRAFLVLSSRVS